MTDIRTIAADRTIPFTEWKAEAEALFGPDTKAWRFECPSCHQTQTLQEFIDAGVEEPETKFFFSCLGRWVPERGCDWTLGGLFQIHKTTVISEDGDPVPVMEFAAAENPAP